MSAEFVLIGSAGDIPTDVCISASTCLFLLPLVVSVYDINLGKLGGGSDPSLLEVDRGLHDVGCSAPERRVAIAGTTIAQHSVYVYEHMCVCMYACMPSCIYV